jgi:hypothetical protein
MAAAAAVGEPGMPYLEIYLQISNLANTAASAITELTEEDREERVKKNTVEDGTQVGDPTDVAKMKTEDEAASRVGQIRGNIDRVICDKFDYMKTYYMRGKSLHAHLFRHVKTQVMYLLFPFVGPIKRGLHGMKVTLPRDSTAYDEDGSEDDSEGGGAAAAEPAKEGMALRKGSVFKATNLAMQELCNGLDRDGHDIRNIVPCGFSLGAWLATQFAYYSICNAPHVPVLHTVAMAPVPVAPLYTGIRDERSDVIRKTTFAFALVIQRGDENVIDRFMMDKYAGHHTPYENLFILTYDPGKQRASFSEGPVDLDDAINYDTDTKKIGKTLQKLNRKIIRLRFETPRAPEIGELTEMAKQHHLTLQELRKTPPAYRPCRKPDHFHYLKTYVHMVLMALGMVRKHAGDGGEKRMFNIEPVEYIKYAGLELKF